MLRVLLLLGMFGTSLHAQSPLVEKFLYEGKFGEGEAVLQTHLLKHPEDDQARFGLGMLQFFKAVEEMGQAWYEYGVKSNSEILFLRLPVPENPDPLPVSYLSLRRVNDQFLRNLEKAALTLSQIQDDHVQLPIQLGKVQFDFIAGKEKKQSLQSIIKLVAGRNFDFTRLNPDILVKFDRGDVAWLRAYCHLIAGIMEFWQAIDWEPAFNHTRIHEAFSKSVLRPSEVPTIFFIRNAEPARFARCRQHLLKVCELNRETWRYIRTEKDDDHEWLPNAKQKGVIGLPLREEMIDEWLEMIGKFESILKGDLLLPLPQNNDEKGFSLKLYLEDAPAVFDLSTFLTGGPKGKYLVQGKRIETDELLKLFQLLSLRFEGGYAAWFN